MWQCLGNKGKHHQLQASHWLSPSFGNLKIRPHSLWPLSLLLFIPQTSEIWLPLSNHPLTLPLPGLSLKSTEIFLIPYRMWPLYTFSPAAHSLLKLFQWSQPPGFSPHTTPQFPMQAPLMQLSMFLKFCSGPFLFSLHPLLQWPHLAQLQIPWVLMT